PVGVLNARRTEQRPFTDLELAALETFAAQAAIAVETTRLFGELRERDDRRRRELERAAAIQQRLLPSSIEGWPGVLEIAHRFRPAVETSGDFFDVLPLTPSRPGDLPPLQVAVGDVAGKGKSAALVTALARSALHAGASVPTGLATPATTLRLAGQRLHRDVGTGHFVACALAVVEPPGLLNAGPLLRVSNAAQVPVLLCRAGTSTEIEPPGDRLPLGARADGAYRDADVELRPGDTVVFSSDGLVEAPSLPTTAVPADLPPPDHPGAFFGFARFAASATHWSQHAASAEDIAAGIWSDLTAWCGDQSHQGFPTGDLDDMTLLVLRVPRYPPGSYPGYDRAGGRARAVTDLSFRL
ncbi:MAG TPA: SpoIIE family protein phosphatase, partial [Chloroflexota bacterium]|nr:SpoIIE family protein phosphatase [Chloroflexota bacterium]